MDYLNNNANNNAVNNSNANNNVSNANNNVSNANNNVSNANNNGKTVYVFYDLICARKLNRSEYMLTIYNDDSNDNTKPYIQFTPTNIQLTRDCINWVLNPSNFHSYGLALQQVVQKSQVTQVMQYQFAKQSNEYAWLMALLNYTQQKLEQENTAWLPLNELRQVLIVPYKEERLVDPMFMDWIYDIDLFYSLFPTRNIIIGNATHIVVLYRKNINSSLQIITIQINDDMFSNIPGVQDRVIESYFNAYHIPLRKDMNYLLIGWAGTVQLLQKYGTPLSVESINLTDQDVQVKCCIDKLIHRVQWNDQNIINKLERWVKSDETFEKRYESILSSLYAIDRLRTVYQSSELADATIVKDQTANVYQPIMDAYKEINELLYTALNNISELYNSPDSTDVSDPSLDPESTVSETLSETLSDSSDSSSDSFILMYNNLQENSMREGCTREKEYKEYTSDSSIHAEFVEQELHAKNMNLRE